MRQRLSPARRRGLSSGVTGLLARTVRLAGASRSADGGATKKQREAVQHKVACRLVFHGGCV